MDKPSYFMTVSRISMTGEVVFVIIFLFTLFIALDITSPLPRTKKFDASNDDANRDAMDCGWVIAESDDRFVYLRCPDMNTGESIPR